MASMPSGTLHLHNNKQHRGARIRPLAAGIAGGGAVALIAYRKRHAMHDEADTREATGESHELRRHVSDMVAFDREMVSSLRKQLDGDLVDPVPSARDVLQRASDAFEQQAGQLEEELGGMNGGPSAMMKKFLAMSIGMVAPLMGGSRTEPVSRILRDDVVGMHMAAVSSSMLHTAALAERQDAIASIAKDGSESFSMLADELQTVLPDAVTMEVEQRQDRSPADANVDVGDESPGRQPSEMPVNAAAYSASNGSSPSGTSAPHGI